MTALRIMSTVLAGAAATVAVTAAALAGGSQLSCQFNSIGISSINYMGSEFLNDGDPKINSVVMQTPQGATLHAEANAVKSFDAIRKTLTMKYPWGFIALAYRVSGNDLTLALTTTNNTPNTIKSISYELVTLRMPSKPVEFDGVSPLLGTNIGAPTVMALTTGKTLIAMANADVDRPLLAGFPWALNKPANTIFPLRVNTARDPAYPDSLPFIDRPIPPNSSDTYNISLHFAPAGTPLSQLESVTYKKFASLYPSQLNWTDRRPVGLLFLARAATNWPSNPRGWLLDAGIDVKSRAGIAEFQKRVLAWADSSVAVLKNTNAQGMVTWDLEGEEFAQPVSYIGDPRTAAVLAPEMNGIADAYFKKFRDAGLKVGVCVRPQRLVIAPDKKSARQESVGDPTQILIAKIKYAKDRWGATLFYIDSNGTPAAPTDVQVIRRVAAAVPGVLLIPEHKNIAYYSTSAPYNELRLGITSTPQQARDIYPGAFEFIYVADGPIDRQYAALTKAVHAGDSLMFRSWFADPANDKVRMLTVSAH